jgi:hypothetical protein
MKSAYIFSAAWLATTATGCVAIHSPLWMPAQPQQITIERACPDVMASSAPRPVPAPVLERHPTAAPGPVIRSEPLEIRVPRLTPGDPLPEAIPEAMPLPAPAAGGGGARSPRRLFAAWRPVK